MSVHRRTLVAVIGVLVVFATFAWISRDGPELSVATFSVGTPFRGVRGTALPHSHVGRFGESSPPQAHVAAASRRGAWDFTGPENHEPSERALSASVSPETRAAIDTAWRAGDHARAAALTAALPELEDRRQILRPLLAEWVRLAPARAVQFALALPEGSERQELLEAAVRGWVEFDVAAASAWLNAFDPHPDFDGAITAIATCDALMHHRPEIALSWAESITAPTARWEAICTIVHAWAQRDPAAALRYVEGAAVLSTAERARIVTHVTERIAAVP